MKNIIILSHKSSGSSALQALLAKFADIKSVKKTRHFENETLYWTKAASLLDMPQDKMIDSEVPMSRKKAKENLITMLEENLDGYQAPNDIEQLIFNGWHKLTEKYQPIFIEKSPHHLYQWSCLELMMEAITRYKDIDFMFVGLVRNPMDMLYSAYKRWGCIPDRLQYEWLRAYKNLRKFSMMLENKTAIVRYEDLTRNLEPLAPVFKFCGVDPKAADQEHFHTQSIAKWKSDKNFGFTLAPEVYECAQSYGYTKRELSNTPHTFWPVVSHFSRSATRIRRALKSR